MKLLELTVQDKNGLVIEKVNWNMGDTKDMELTLVIDNKEYTFNNNGELLPLSKPHEIWKVRYSNPLVGDKGEALYYTCKARNDKHAITQAMRCNEFMDKIYMKHFDFKYFDAYKPKHPKKEEIGKVEYFEGDPRL